MRILATGAAGMLGSHFDDARIVKTDIETLDVRDMSQVAAAFGKHSPDIVLHLAAETDVDLCEIQPDHAYKTNVIGTENVALCCQRHGVGMVYVSTAGVFNGNKPEPYTEMDEPDPVNMYGRTKWEGEKIVRSLVPRSYVIRTGWMMGGFDRDKKFVGKILKLMIERDEIDVVEDKIGSPTFAQDLARGILDLIATQRYGLYHMTNAGVCSRYEVALEIARLLRKQIEINPITSAAFPLPASRANSEAMRNYKLEMLGLNGMRHWKDALADYLAQWESIGLPCKRRPQTAAVV